jgi:purine/pyrimidine-nucleoside phosphorylase
MSSFENVAVVRKANVYFEGKVTSRTVVFRDGSRKTLGVMLPGEYAFDTDAKELMEIQSGDLDVRLPDAGWKTFRGGESFEVPAKARFELKVRAVTDYCCSFMP